jgi:dUTP pyrophosphatase
MEIGVQLVHINARMPYKFHKNDAAYDISSPENHWIPPHSTVSIDAGFKLNFPDISGYYMQLHSRSGLSLKGIRVEAGVIDVSYRGNICVILSNRTNEPYYVRQGDRIAQMIIHKIDNYADFNLVEAVDATDRNEKGFGSSDIKNIAQQ